MQNGSHRKLSTDESLPLDGGFGVFLGGVMVAVIVGPPVLFTISNGHLPLRRGDGVELLDEVFLAVAGTIGIVSITIQRRAQRRRRRLRAGQCIRCGYDLRGSFGRCPECGSDGSRFAEANVAATARPVGIVNAVGPTMDEPHHPSLPPLADLGTDLLRLTPAQRWSTVAIPFAAVAAYAVLAHWRWWPLAVLSLVYLSFATYGSISHDLVHRTLGLPRRANEFFLTAIELLAFRSGHAYRLVHLHHHARFPHDDDVEGAAAKMSLLRTIGEGIIFQPKIMAWALAKHGRTHRLVVAEIIAAVALLVGCFAVLPWTPVPAVYAVLMVMGSWVIPLATSYLPHNADGRSALTQTKLFRGRVASIIALEHLYHLEHHLYPMVPHHNWPALARRLDPYFDAAGLEPIVLGF